MSLRVTIVVLAVLLTPAAGVCHHEASHLRKTVLFELKSIAAELKFARHRLERLLSTRGQLSNEILAEAQNAYYQQRPTRAAQLLMDLLARPDFKEHPGRSEALAWLAEAFVKLEFRQAASRTFAEAIQLPKQSVTAYEHRFERLLDVNDGSVGPDILVRAWSRYRVLRETKHPKFSVLRYKAGRALYRSGGYTQAEGVFRTVVPDDPEFVRAQYFLGVIHLRRGELVDAERIFKVALDSWHGSKQKTVRLEDDVDPAGDRLELQVSKVKERTETQIQHQKIGFALHLTSARLAAHRGEFETALSHYRRIPPGAPGHPKAVRETIYILSQLSEFDWAARTMSGTLPKTLKTTDDFLRALEYARLLAKGERYQDADTMFNRVAGQVSGTEDSVVAHGKNLKTQGKAAAWLLPDRVEDWTEVASSPEDLGDLVSEAQLLLTELTQLVSAGDELPVVQQGARIEARIRGRLVDLQATISELAGSDGVDEAEPRRFAQSLGRLEVRLTRFKARIQDYRDAYASRLANLVRAEATAVASLRSQLMAHGEAVAQHRKGLVPILRARLASHDTGAVLGQVNIAYWRKEAVSERIERLIRQQREASAPVETFPVEASDPTGPAEISTGPDKKRPLGVGTERGTVP